MERETNNTSSNHSGCSDTKQRDLKGLKQKATSAFTRPLLNSDVQRKTKELNCKSVETVKYPLVSRGLENDYPSGERDLIKRRESERKRSLEKSSLGTKFKDLQIHICKDTYQS